MAQSKKQLENDFVYWMDKSQECANAIRKLSVSPNEIRIGNTSPSQINAREIAAEKKRLQQLKEDADLSAKEIQHKISTLYKLQ